MHREMQPAAGPAQAQTIAADGELLEVVIGHTKYSKADRDLLRRTICRDASEDQFALFMRYAERTGLDPFARQIHLVIRKGKACIQTGIDGLRLIADRTKRYAGNDAPVFEGEGTFAGARVHPLKATVTVYKLVEGTREPFTATMRWEEYYPGDGDDGFMWRKMPFNQLGKCAEAAAFRKAFPADLAGVMTAEDLDAPAEDLRADAPKPLATYAQKKALDALRVRLNLDAAAMTMLIAEHGFRSSNDLTAEAADQLLAQLNGRLADEEANRGRGREPGEEG